MGCACGKGKGRTTYQVVLTNDQGTEKIVYQTTDERSATTVSARYQGSTVRKTGGK